uniref:Uncharacterized protein n=1 Tax=Chrysotila carterae TaxID=13221 RepID=A0A7S4BB82_CHRCT|mmetsp:Transcript_5526/g.12038  ORF Transcript_5526/g.12038 Transcript_5526/m.12038 type:complete len:109 (-) Transcript_5526:1154-1480(-)|eukprot:3295738-Pleurochrysis_carterae.AAC.1
MLFLGKKACEAVAIDAKYWSELSRASEQAQVVPPHQQPPDPMNPALMPPRQTQTREAQAPPLKTPEKIHVRIRVLLARPRSCTTAPLTTARQRTLLASSGRGRPAACA